MTLIRRALLAPAVLLTAGACFATRNDVRLLQSDLQVVRTEATTARADAEKREAIQQARIDSTLASIAHALRMVGDTVRSMHTTTMRLRGDVREDLVAIRQQLITVEARVGASAQRIQELRAGLEADATERAAQPIDTTRPPVATGAPTASPGPAQLNELALEQLRGGRWGAARGAFGALLAQYPRSDLAPDALFGIGQAYEKEGKEPWG